jgi:hypothetical protein
MKPPHLIRDFITRANVNQLISGKGFSGEIDLFSLDMDGVDWCALRPMLARKCASARTNLEYDQRRWIWHALDVVKPRLVIVEIQELWLWTVTLVGSDRAPARPAWLLRLVHTLLQINFALGQ